MAVNNYSPVLEADYPGFEKFTQVCLNPVFGPVEKANVNINDRFTVEDHKIIKDAFVFGHSDNFDFAKLYFFDITLNEKTDIARNRVAIQRVVRKCLDKYDAGLMLFHYSNNDKKDWRLSFVRKEKTVKDSTSAKRYSYLCGKGHFCRTAAERFSELKEINGRKSLEQVVSAFSIETLTEEFYKDIFRWYEWAKTLAEFPNEKGGDQARRTKKGNDIHLIRLVTRLIFVWFMKQSNLIPKWIFDEDKEIGLSSILADFSPNSEKKGSYYNGILQNLFFATLNREILDAKGKPNRQFTEHDEEAINSDYAISYKYRDNRGKSFFKESHAEIIKHFEKIPFLNGGLFECLDSYEADGKDKKHGTKYYKDGFSREEKRRAFVPDCLFWGNTGSNEGIINILMKYNFTIEENTPSDIEVALDPELLGKVFENLLGYINPETHEMARKSSGSFYTPREIVSYMVDESLATHIKTNITALSEEDIHNLFSEDFVDNNTIIANKEKICTCLKEIKILDPACGSGAFPMGILNRMIELLQKLEGIKTRKQVYELKLRLIENCIYGIDIQTIAVQIAKLRFFISLVCEQERNDKIEENYGIKPLPNLETKFVAANALIGLPEESGNFLDLNDKKLDTMKKTLWEDIRRRHFYAKGSEEKKELQRKDEKKRSEIMAYLLEKGSKPNETFIAQLEKQIEVLQQERIIVAHENLVDETETQSDLDFGISKSPNTLYQVDKNQPKRDDIDREIKRLIAEKTKEENRGKNLGALSRGIDLLATWNPYDQNETSPFFDSVWMFDIDKGFDIVIGNPPYVQLQTNHGELANMYQNCNFDTFTRTGDIYQLFYEKGISLLCNNGILCYITSNKWMRAGYGEETRKYFSENVQTLQLVDFAGQKVFKSATVDVSITVIRKNNTPKETMACTIKEKSLLNLTDYIKQSGTYIPFPRDGKSWVILSDIEQRIKEKIEKAGKPLKDWDINIYRGILTGCNEAFIMNKEKRDELIKKSPKSAEIIRPILRGRDIKRYGYEFADLYLLFIPWHFPLHLDTTITGASKEAELIFKKEYPAVYNHLNQYKDILSARNTAETGIRYEWYALQRWGANYWEDFSKQKIMYPNMTKFLPFYLDNQGFYQNDKSFMIVGQNIAFLAAFLNSSLFKYCYIDNFPELQGGTRELRKIFVDKIPVLQPTKEQNTIFASYVLKLQKMKNQRKRTKALELEIDDTIFDLYGLSPKEKNVVGFIEIK
jgi:hypothetical protein